MRTRKKWPALISLIVFALISIGVVNGVRRAQNAVSPKPDEMLALAKAHGLPTSPADLYRGYEPKPEDDAYPELIILSKLLNKDRLAKFQLLQQIKYFDQAKDKNKAAQDILTKSESFLAQINRVASKNAFKNQDILRHDVDFRSGATETADNAVTILCGRAIAYAQLGKKEEAINTIRTAVRVQSLLLNQPSLIDAYNYLSSSTEIRWAAIHVSKMLRDDDTFEACRAIIREQRVTDAKRALLTDFTKRLLPLSVSGLTNLQKMGTRSHLPTCSKGFGSGIKLRC